MTTTLSSPSTARRAATDLLWRGLSGRRAGLLLAAAFIAALTLGNLLPQLPPDAAADVGERTRWLVTTASAYGAWGPWLQRVGLFDVAHAPWWEGLLALGLGYALLRLADGVERAGQRLGRSWAMPAAAPHALYVAEGAAEKAEAIGQRLGQSDAAVAVRTVDGATFWRAVRRRWSAAAEALAWLGVVLLLLWLLFGEQGAWRVGSLSLPPDQPVPLGQGTGLSLRLTADTAGERIVWLQGETEVARTGIGPGQPAHARGIGLHWRGDGPTLAVVGGDGAGQPLTFEPVTGGAAPGPTLHLVFDRGDEQTFAVAAYGLAFRVLALEGGAFQVEAYHSGEESPFFSDTLAEAATVRIEEADYTFTPGRFVQVAAQHTPLFPLLPLAGLLLAVGVGLRWGWPAQALWLRATPAGKGTWFEWATEGAMPDDWLRDALAVGEQDG